MNIKDVLVTLASLLSQVKLPPCAGLGSPAPFIFPNSTSQLERKVKHIQDATSFYAA